MNSELTNLLPEERIRALRREYFLQLAVVALGLATTLVVIMGVLLIPTSVYVSQEVWARQAKLKSLEASSASADQVAVEAQLSAIGKNVAVLAALAQASSPSTVISNTLQVPRTGITISGITFTPAQGNKSGQMVITGIADSRDSLRAYQLALLGASFVKSADLPISAYASDTHIVFTITVTLATNV